MPIHAGKYKSMSMKNGGGSNTPLPHQIEDFTVPIKLDKRWVIDWVSYTFSDVAYEKKTNKYTDDIDYTLMETKQNDYILNSILHILNYGQKWKSIKIHNKSVNGYKFSWFLGEFMRINFAGPKMKNGNPSTQILFSGSACREFEDDYNGSFIDLFRFLRAEHTELGYQTNENGEIISGVKLNGSFKRIDFAIDDFTGKELNIYDLKEFADNYHWTGPYRTVDIHSSSISNHGMIQSKGFTITFGSAGSNQLQIYDKFLEYQSKGKSFNGSNTWYRYEMRFVDPKADAVVKEFLFANQNGTLSDFAYSLLFKQIKFRIPKDTNKNKNYWDILPEWLEFLHYVKELELKVENLPIRTFEKKLDWIDYSLVTTFTQLYLAYRDDPYKFKEELFKYINKGAMKFTEQHLASINKYLKDNNKPVVTKEEYIKMTTRGLQLKGEDK